MGLSNMTANEFSSPIYIANKDESRFVLDDILVHCEVKYQWAQ